jgi:hypothetical protein
MIKNFTYAFTAHPYGTSGSAPPDAPNYEDFWVQGATIDRPVFTVYCFNSAEALASGSVSDPNSRLRVFSGTLIPDEETHWVYANDLFDLN